MLTKISGLLFLLCGSMSVADSPKMNGIELHQYGDFTKDWRQITVRYRKDTSEMRFTFANSIAAKAVEKGIYPLPEGSVLAKVGFKGGFDPAFDSSVVPTGTRRFQFMVKNSKKFKDTDGWGYALFQSDGQLFPGEEKSQTLACHACHRLVPERDYVFSEFAQLSPLATQVPQAYALVKNEKHLKFVELKVGDAVGSSAKFLKQHRFKSIKVLAGEMRERFFGGTLDEITPVLIHEAMATTQQKSAAFVSLDGETFKVVKLVDRPECKGSESGVNIWERRKEWESEGNPLRESTICYPKTYPEPKF